MLSFHLVLFLCSALSVARHLQGDDTTGGPCLQSPGTDASTRRWSKDFPASLMDVAVVVPGTTMAEDMVSLVAHFCAG